MKVISDFIHQEGVIGTKMLSDADLGRSPLSNQTHIGLSVKTLTFLRNGEIVNNALFIYEDSCVASYCNFDKIFRENGDVNAPKIRKGYNGDSVVDKIRVLSKNNPGNNWYLIWFGLKDRTLVFLLVKENSKEYFEFSNFLSKNMKIYSIYQSSFKLLTNLIERKLSQVSIIKTN